MFQTLKARRSNTGESAYVVQSSCLPSEKDKGKKPRACAFCKLKKLKCLIEGDSCAKCLKQGLECSYRSTNAKKNTPSSPSSSRRLSRSKHELRALSPTNNTSSTPEPVSHTSPSSPFGGRTAGSFPEITPALPTQGTVAGSSTATSVASLSGFSVSEFFDGDINLDFLDIPHDGVNGCDTPMYLTSNDMTDCHLDATGFTPMHTSAPSHLTPPSPLHDGIESPGDDIPMAPYPSGQHTPSASSGSVGWKPSPVMAPRPPPLAQLSNIPSSQAIPSEQSRVEQREPGSPHTRTVSCRCLERVMSANEAMQVKLVWVTSADTGSAVSVDDTLQCQKDMLASCGDLLECLICTLRSDYIMLVVSMCREMIAAIIDLSATIASDGQHRSRKRSCSEATDGSWTSVQRVNAGVWRLDDQDEMVVIKSLIRIRVTRLRNLIARLEAVVKTHHPDYEWIVRALGQTVPQKLVPIE
ncbi:hypothetical protein F4679DRAFT_83452 [Xylaria curta]|nr:hypothetical protein F4679DRAFT_83452 [Xylaria curta]